MEANLYKWIACQLRNMSHHLVFIGMRPRTLYILPLERFYTIAAVFCASIRRCEEAGQLLAQQAGYTIHTSDQHASLLASHVPTK